MSTRALSTLVLILSSLQTSCGTFVPQLHEAWEQADVADPDLVYRIKKSIYCELRLAVDRQKNQAAPGRPDGQAIPDDWGAQLTLALQVAETGAVNPGATYSHGLGGTDLFSLGAGAALSSESTRIDKYYSYFSVAQLKQPIGPPDTSCGEYINGSNKLQPLDRSGSSLLLGNLGIDAWLNGALRQENGIPSSPQLKGSFQKLDVISYDIKFVVITSGSITPTWKFVTLTAGPAGSAFASAGRTRTHELILTLGPADIEKPARKGRKAIAVSTPSGPAASVHLSNEIGQAVGAALQSGVRLRN